MPQFKVTPWRHQSELLHIRSQLYPAPGEDNDERRQAIEVVSGSANMLPLVTVVNAWSVRGRLPHAVEATAALTAAILSDTGNALPYCTEFIYSGALSFFVTRLVDPGRKGIYVKSMYVVAERIGLPASFVDLRHDATHGPVPSLVVLRDGARRALAWLWDHYWATLTDDAARTEERLRDVLRQLVKTRLGARRNDGARHEDMTVADETAKELLRIVRERSNYLASLASVLVEDRLMIPANRALGSNMEGAFLLLEDLLKLLITHHNPFFSHIVDRLVDELAAHDSQSQDLTRDPRCEASYLWLVRIFSHQDWASQRESAGPELPDTMIARALMAPNVWTIRFAETVMTSRTDQDAHELWDDVIALAKADQAGFTAGLIDESQEESDDGEEHGRHRSPLPSHDKAPWIPKPIGCI